MNLAAFIFNLDNIISGADHPNYRAWKQLAGELGLDFDREIYQKLGRVSRRDFVEGLFDDQNIDEKGIQAALDRQNSLYLRSIEKLTPRDILPGALSLIEELRSAGVRIGFFSEHKNAQKALDSVGLTPLVDTVGDGVQVKSMTPEPDLLLFIAHEMAIKPENCVVITDQQKGIEAANHAGMYVIALDNQERLAGADVHYPSLQSVTLDQIRNDLDTARPY